MPRRLQQCWFLAVVLVLSGLLAAGCGKKAGEKAAEGMLEKTLEQSTGGDAEVDLGGGDVTVKTPDGTTTMSETTEWPGDMFEGVPQFTYGAVERVTRSDRQDGTKAVMVYLRDVEAGGPESYAKVLEGAGWQSQSSVSSGQGGMLSAQKGNVALSLMYNNEDKTAVLNVYSVAE